MKITEKLCVRISQRYVLVLLCMSGLMLTTLNRLTFSLLMDNFMYKKKEPNKVVDCPSMAAPHTHSVTHEEFTWGKDLQLNIIAAWSMGYMMGTLPTGLLVNRLGAKTVYGYSVFVTGICALLTPLCARSSPYIIMANRVLNGIFSSALHPCIAWFAAHWFPGRDMGFMLNLTLAGFPLGCLIMFPMAHRIFHIFHKWMSVYYVTGVMTLVWAYVWQACIWDDPFNHPYISKRELEFLADEITMYAYDTELEPGWKWPWKSILTSGPLFNLALADIGYSFLSNFATLVIPTLYFPDIHQHQFINNESLGMLVYAMMALAMMAAGVTRDKLVSNRWFSVTNIVKTYYGVGSVLASVFLLLLTHAGCTLTTVYIWYIAAMMCIGVGYGVWVDACVSLAPNFAPTNIAVTGTLGNMGLSLQVYTEGQLPVNGSLEDWKLLSYLNAAIAIFPVAVFLKYGKCNTQRWNEPEPKRWLEIDYETPEESNPRKPGANANAGDALELKEPVEEMQPQVEKRQTENGNFATTSQTTIAEVKAKRSAIQMNKSATKIKKSKTKIPIKEAETEEQEET